MRYDAFISYSHSADGRLAPAVQTGLQRLARPWYRRRALQVFRDETGLTVNPHLWNSISDAMGEARYFVLLASPEAARSPWVNREIAHWLVTKPADTLMPVLTDGTLVWDNELGDFDPASSSALPPALVGAFADEPRHLDMRWARDEAQLDLRHSRFRSQVATMAAPMHGIAREDLEGEDVRLHRRALRLAWGAGIVLVVLTILSFVGAGFAVSYAATAREQRRQAVVLGDRATRQESLAQRNARLARTQKAAAEANARRATDNATEAKKQRDLAEHNAEEAAANGAQAEANAKEAAANGARAQEKAAEATANASKAERNAIAAQQAADQAAANAAEAKRNATEAQSNARRARQLQLVAEANARRAEEERRRAEDNAILALSRQVAAQAQNNTETHYDLALLEAVEANRLRETPQARDSLLRILLAHPEVRMQLRPEQGDPWGGILVSPKGTTIAAANGDGGAQFWDATTGELRAELAAEGGVVIGATFGPDDEIAVGYQFGLVIVDATTGSVRARVPIHLSGPPFGAFAFAPNGITLAVATGTVIDLWDVSAEPRLTDSFAVGPSAGALTFSPDSSALAWSESPTGLDSSAKVFVRHVDDGRQLGPLEVHAGPELSGDAVFALVFSPDGGTLESVAPVGDDAVVFWDLATGSRTASLAVMSGRAVSVSPDQRLVAIEDDASTYFADARTGTRVSSVPTGDVSALVVQSFTPDGKSFVTPSSDGSIRVVDIVPDWPGRKFPVTNSDDFRPQLSPDGTLVAVVHDGSISVIDVMTGEIVAERPADFVFSIYFGPQNRTLAWDDGDFVRLMDLEGGDVRQLPDHGTYGTDVAFSPDGRTVAEIAYHSVRLWDVATGMPAAAQPPELLGDAVGVAYSPDGTLAVSEDQDGTDGITELFAPGQARRLIRFGGGGLLFSPDGKVLAVDGAGGRVLFSMRDGKPLGGRLPANDLAFGRDGETFATIDYRGVVQLRDVVSGLLIGPALPGTIGEVTSLAFTSSGRLVTAASGEVIEWDLDQGSLMRRACTVANRDLTQQEWTQLIGDTLPYDPPCAAVLAGTLND